MKIKQIFTLFVVSLMTMSAYATIQLEAYYIKDGSEVAATESFTAEAPLHVRFVSNAADLSATSQIEWHFHNAATGTSVTRYEENTDYDFVEAGVTEVKLLVRDNNEIVEEASINITISASHLEMPNAFSPNGDGINDKYMAKSNHKSIVEFHAYIFNRYGQKIYDWDNINDGWDGTSHGHPVKDGVYYVYVKARGADGIEYDIKRDVNLLRNFNIIENTTTP